MRNGESKMCSIKTKLLAAVVSAMGACSFPAAGSEPAEIACDVCVVGGGSAGFAAALAAAENGCDTVLVEKEAVLGGTSTIAGVNNWEPVCGADGIPERVHGRLAAIPGACGIWKQVLHSSYGDDFPGALLEIDGSLAYADTLRRHGKSMTADKSDWLARYHGIVFEPSQMDAVMRSMLNETGKCRVMLSTEFTSCQKQDGRIVSLALSDGTTVRPKVTIDACGAVARSAGCETVSAAAPNGVTLVFRVSSRAEAPEIAVPEETPDAPWSGWGSSFPPVWCARYPNGDLMVNMLPTMSGAQARELGVEQTYAECRRRVFAQWKWMKATYPGHFGGCKLAEICSRAAYRDTRRVVCEHVLTGDDVRNARRFADEIATADHAFDSHGSSTAYSGELSAPYGIPLRSLVPVGFTNFYVAGRIAGFDDDAASSCRLSRTMMKLGEAAGNAAANDVAGKPNFPKASPWRPTKFVEYVQATGSQYVKLDYVPNGRTTVQAQLAIDDRGVNSTLVCSRREVSDTFSMFYIGNTGFRWDFGVQGNDGLVSLPDGEMHDVRFSGSQFVLDGDVSTVITPIPNDALTAPGGAVLFASGYYDEKGEVFSQLNNYARMKLYSLKFYEGSELMVDLYPCINATGVAALWDNVGEKVYASAPATPLVAGEKEISPFATSGVNVVSENPVGTALPVYGMTEVAPGETVRCSVSPAVTNAEETACFECAGYRLFLHESDTEPWKEGTDNSFEYVQPEEDTIVRLVWLWREREIVELDWTYDAETSTIANPGGWVLGVTCAGKNLTVVSLNTAGSGAKLDFRGVRGGYRIVKFADNDTKGIFEGQKGITEVVLPAQLTYLGSRVFCNATNLAKISPALPETLQYLGHRAFVNCALLTGEMRVGGENFSCTLNATGYQFFGCSGLDRVVLSSKVSGLVAHLLAKDAELAAYCELSAKDIWSDGSDYEPRIRLPVDRSGGCSLFSATADANNHMSMTEWDSLSDAEKAKFVPRAGETEVPFGLMTAGLGKKTWIMKVPAEYKGRAKAWLDYVRLDGRQCFNTGVVPSADLEVELRAKMANDAPSSGLLIGAEFGLEGFCFDHKDAIGGDFAFRSGGLYDKFTAPPPDEDGAVTIRLKQGCYRTGAAREYTALTQGAATGKDVQKPLWVGQVFGNNRTNWGKFDLLSLKMYDKGVLVRDFMPALDQKGVPCLFDKVGKKLYYSIGPQEFVPSPNSRPRRTGIVISVCLAGHVRAICMMA